ncbi:MAG: RNA-binding protein [Lachnospiraceae bacterium]|jgi:ribosomal protein L14E/L6E/L27E|nr:RNA-binding protein [Lachnospiraceae bacterium]MDE6941389.1 KOW domain-containing RNA-binding protein [Lachnospiraceae bacterium]MDE6989033.1 KOW domain-containing RNA-binding protein [Lachnospiraceae bacterium]MDE7002695.1 KOW domain-containing RNA-binding protein [Lachnospiraceae bacterium]
MIGFLACSLAGHDKGEIYLIVEETQDSVYVADGAVRTLDRPKKKNKRHVQIIKKENQRIDISSVTNEEIKHFIKLYMKGIKEVK